MKKSLSLIAALLGSNAQAGTFLTATIDGSFAEWAGVPVLSADGGDNAGFVDIGNVQIANDDNFLYISVTYPNTLSAPTYISIDSDSNSATGFDIFSVGLVGVEASWQNDFPFTNGTGAFNNGLGMSGDFFGSGAALISSPGDVAQKEWAISLDITFNEDGSNVFDDPDFDILIWTDAGAGDVSDPISYTLATAIPETSSIALLGLASLGLLRRQR